MTCRIPASSSRSRRSRAWADAVDVRRMQQNRADEKRAFSVCEERIAKHKLDMKLVDVEYTLDRNKILFYFTADGRIDFRDLVKDLAGVFRTRHRAAADRRTGREQNAGRLGYLRPAVLLQPFSAGSSRCPSKWPRNRDSRSIRPRSAAAAAA